MSEKNAIGPRMKRAGAEEVTPDGMERVQVSITGSADLDIFMPIGLADKLDDFDQSYIDEIVEAAGSDLINDFEFAVDTLAVAKSKKKGAKT